MTEQATFYGLNEDQLGAMAARPPRRKPASDKADIGGRMRIATIMREAGIAGAGTPVRIAGSTNEVWAAGAFVIRVSFDSKTVRLRREAGLSTLLSPEVRYPDVVARGSSAFGEWLITERRPGSVLSEQWLSLEQSGRRAAVHDLAATIRSLHTTELTTEQVGNLWPDSPDGSVLTVEEMNHYFDLASMLPNVEKALLADARARMMSAKDAYADHERWSLVHGDLHLENVLSQDSKITALLDLEWAHLGAAEEDIDTLARFCIAPELHINGGYPVEVGAFRDVLRWFAEGYPSLFENPKLRDRLTWCAFSYEMQALLEMPPHEQARKLPVWHPINRIIELVNHGADFVRSRLVAKTFLLIRYDH